MVYGLLGKAALFLYEMLHTGEGRAHYKPYLTLFNPKMAGLEGDRHQQSLVEVQLLCPLSAK